MMHRSFRRPAACTVALLAAGVTTALAGPASAAPVAAVSGQPLSPGTRFYTPHPDPAALHQIAATKNRKDKADARLVRREVRTPQAVWFTGGTATKPQGPVVVRRKVADVVGRASAQHRVPVLVAYNVPGRDCSQYSAGGAATEEQYRAWIAAFARGIGTGRAVVILEPDGLALSPDQCGGTDEQQQERVREIRSAVQVLAAHRRVNVYIDSGHSSWHNSNEMAGRLVTGGIAKARGFFLNVSNFRTDSELRWYGRLVSTCAYYVRHGGDWNTCPSQYTDHATAAAWIAANIPVKAPLLPHFVIDSSRNGRGPWTPPADHPDGDAQDWCNPPDRGLGVRPTAATPDPLLDAYLWIKTPGQSDGQCTRWADPAAHVDPVRGMVDPPAGVWFPEQALELVHFAKPPLE